MAKPPANPAWPVAPETALPEGRSLADFGELFEAEIKLRDHCRSGTVADLAPGDADAPAERETANVRPEKTEANTVRAGFVRFLALGGDETTPVHENGVQLRGAWLTDVLDLKAAEVKRPLVLHNCIIDRIEAAQSSLKVLDLNGSKLTRGMDGEGLRCEGNILLREYFCATGEVQFIGATIGGSLDCGGAVDQYVAYPPRRGGRFLNPGGRALVCDHAVISGGVFLNFGFCAVGEVRLVGTTIGREFDCSDGEFAHGRTVGDEKDLDTVGCDALCCEQASVAGALFFRCITKFDGAIAFSAMHVGSLCDDADSWRHATGGLSLDGFTYERLVGPAPADAKTRIAWLDLQSRKELRDFKPQPWEQMIAVLRTMGHPNAARKLAMAKQKRLGKAGKIPLVARPLHWLYGVFVGYGYAPGRLLIAVLAMWLLFAEAYREAAHPSWTGTVHLIEPANREPSAACLAARAAARSGDPCPPPAVDFNSFSAYAYSADVLLPIVDLGYQEQWRPVLSDASGNPLVWGHRLRAVLWVEILLGWLVGGALVAMLGKLIKKD